MAACGATRLFPQAPAKRRASQASGLVGPKGERALFEVAPRILVFCGLGRRSQCSNAVEINMRINQGG